MKPVGDNEGYILKAVQIDNQANTAETEPETPGSFPGVACFFRSANQMNRLYGTSEGNFIPEFGFDTYIPLLHGTKKAIQDKYSISQHIVTSYTAQVADDDSTNINNIHIYPHIDEWETGALAKLKEDEKVEKQKNGGKPKALKGGQLKKYFIPWLIPSSKPSTTTMTLHVNILFPKNQVSKDDQFRKFKKSETTENIYFKLVKVDPNWNPIEVSKYDATINGRKNTSNQYVPIELAEPLSDVEKNYYDSEISRLENEIKKLEGNISDSDSQLDKNYQAKIDLEKERDKYNDVLNKEENEIDKERDTLNMRRLSSDHPDIIKFKEKDEDWQKRTLEWNRTKKNPNEKEVNEKITALEKDSEKVRADKIEHNKNLKEAQVELAKCKEIRGKDSINPIDKTFKITSQTPFAFEFDSNSTSTTVTIKGNGDNIRQALIAYYIREDKGIKKEYIIGQVNILAKKHYLTLPTYDHYAHSFDMPLYFNPIPVHFIKVSVKEKAKKAKRWSLPEGITLRGMVNNMNDYFLQANIGFVNRKDFSEMELMLSKIDSKTYLTLPNDNFLIHKGSSLATEGNGEKKIQYELQAYLAKYILNTFIYNNPQFNDGVEITAKKAEEKDCPEWTSNFDAFLKKYPQLVPTKTESGILGNKEVPDKGKLYKKVCAIAEFLSKNIFFFFLFDNYSASIDLDKKDRTKVDDKSKAAAFTEPNYNIILVFKDNNFAQINSTLIHEMGHSLSLSHTFSSNYPLYPEKVSFDTDWTNKIKDFSNGDHKGYAATYDNIMDYNNKLNPTFTRRSFTKAQSDQMLDSAIIHRSKKSYENLDDLKIFSNVNESALSTDKKIVLGEGDKKYLQTHFITDILNII